MIADLPLDRGSLDGWVTLAALAGDRFDLAEAYFIAAEAGDPGLDRRGQGAYFIGTIAYYLAAAIAADGLLDQGVPEMNGQDFGLIQDGPDAMHLRYRVAAGAGPSQRPIGEIVEAILVPLIARVKAATRLAEPAQWRLVADSVASAFLSVGTALECVERAQEAAMAVVRDPRFKPFNGHTGYHQLDNGAVYLRRGGCCRYYTCEGGAYCATCVLRPPEEQLAQLRAR